MRVPFRILALMVVLIAGSAAFAVSLAGPAFSQTPPTGPEGNWQVEWLGSTYEDTPDSVRISLYRERVHTCDRPRMEGCFFVHTAPPDADWLIDIEAEGGERIAVQSVGVDPAAGTLEIKHYYGIFDYWGGVETAQQTGPDAITGNWSGNDEAGNTVWRRIIPQITGLTVSNSDGWSHVSGFEALAAGHVEITMPWTHAHWNDEQNFPGQRPYFDLNVFGTDLWGRHTASIPASMGFDVYGISHKALADGTPYLAIEIVLWPGARPGRHTLILDGQPIEIDLKVPGFPEDPENITIGPMRFTGLSRYSVPQTGPLRFTGLSTPHDVTTSGMIFTGYSDPRLIQVRDSLVFEGWGGGLAGQITPPVSFTGWRTELAHEVHQSVIFTGWKWQDKTLTTAPLKFRGHGAQ